MFTNNFLVFTCILSVLFAIHFVQQVKSAPAEIRHTINFNQYPIVYRRYVRRRPPLYLQDQYMDEIMEIFDTKEKPPAYGAIMTDEDVDKFIFCDFNRDSDMCKQYWEVRKPETTTPIAPVKPSMTSTTSKSKSATFASKTDPTTDIAGIPHFDETEYIYSDENQDMENNLAEDNDYYAEEY